MSFIKKYWNIIIIFLFLFLFTIQHPLDLDLGWHLRYGQYFFQTGHILKDNILSFIWPGYKWVQASWGYDLFVYQVFKYFGFAGLSLGGAIFTVLIFLIITRPIKRFAFNQLLFLMMIYLTQVPPLYYTGMRSQTPSALFFALAIVIGYKFEYFYFLPFLFLIWANMHGGFSLGLMLLLFIWGLQGFLIFIKKKFQLIFSTVNFKKWCSFGLMLFLSILTPLINPWGLKTYTETFKHTTNINLTTISEWMPLTWKIAPIEILVVIFLLFLVIFVWSRKRKIEDLPYLAALLVSAYLGISAIRFLINFGIIITYYFAQNIDGLQWKIFRDRFFQFIISSCLISLILVDLLITKRYLAWPKFDVFNFSWNDYCLANYDCSENVTQVMLKNIPKGNGYTHYNYGGYLTWRVPQVKTFIDGRMAAWEDDRGQVPPVLKSDSAMVDNVPFTWISLDNQYHFRWAIVFANTPITGYLNVLTKSGFWRLVYRDQIYSYYVKN